MTFERGDIVVYVHPEAPAEGRGSVAIVCNVSKYKPFCVDVKWISTNEYLSPEGQEATSLGWDLQSFKKVGHIDLPDEVPLVPHE